MASSQRDQGALSKLSRIQSLSSLRQHSTSSREVVPPLLSPKMRCYLPSFVRKYSTFRSSGRPESRNRVVKVDNQIRRNLQKGHMKKLKVLNWTATASHHIGRDFQIFSSYLGENSNVRASQRVPGPGEGSSCREGERHETWELSDRRRKSSQ